MTGKKLLDMILLLLMIVTTLAVIGFFYFTEKIYKRPPINEVSEKEAFFKETVSKALPALFKIDKMIISLVPNSPSANLRMKYLEVELSLVLFGESDKKILITYLDLVQNNIIMTASKMSSEELNTLTGKILLESRLKKEINGALKKEMSESLKKPVVKGIFFSTYIVQ